MTHPELTTFKTGIVPDFLNVRSVCLHFIRRDDGERNVGYIKYPVTLQQCFRNLSMCHESYSHLGLSITVIYSIDKTLSAQCVSKLGIELLASFRCVGLGKVDNCQICKFHYTQNL